MRLYQLRGQAKRDVAIPHFKLHHPLSPKVANANREVIATLKEHNEEPIEHKNVYRNTVICDVITKLWYGEKQKSEAVLFPDYFKNGIPLVTIAFVSTSKTGEFKKVTFSAKVYEAICKRHLKSLTKWKDFSDRSGSGATAKLQEELWVYRRECAGFTSHSLNDDDFDSLSDNDFA
ncbi:hypothetical protein LshimejAT787_1501250 [Lyophyllum shimeji]|uniref:DUF6532 domain-containing protein n=1 Tax=Lyophyllum shimeji TaxID=47721 RepID=A0A9P3PYG9_LYOSH|nr:hypothetical protein LshimejAT787_1501250 [Lyophyllum shimeji]